MEAQKGQNEAEFQLHITYIRLTNSYMGFNNPYLGLINSYVGLKYLLYMS